jgi:GTPase SAR1 family protein
VVNLAGYSMVLYEDETKNRMTEALELMGDSAKAYFKDIPVFLVLNKRDLFEKSLETIPLKQCFPDYTGDDSDSKSAIEFISKKFQDALPAGSPPMKVFVVSAHSGQDINDLFKDLTSQLITMNFAKIDAQLKLIQK